MTVVPCGERSGSSTQPSPSSQREKKGVGSGKQTAAWANFIGTRIMLADSHYHRRVLRPVNHVMGVDKKANLSRLSATGGPTKRNRTSVKHKERKFR